MNCPPEIAGIILDMITTAALRIRVLGWAGNAQRCAIEADHIHNLPALLRGYSPDLLRFYWEVERTSFIDLSSAAEIEGFQPLWDRLASHVPGPADSVRVG